jgi:hypothetical protein
VIRFRAFLLLIAPLAMAAEPDALDIVRRSLAAETENAKLSTNYTFLQRTEEREFGSNGEIKSRRSRTHDVTMLSGSSTLRRLIERDDKPLPPDELAREQELLQKSLEDRRHETEAQRSQRMAETEKRPGRSREMLKEVPDAFVFRLRGEETIGSRPAYVIDAMPRLGYRGKNAQARLFLPNMKATFWIDKGDFNWVRMEAEVIDNISYGWFLFRLAKGAHLKVERIRVNDEVWLPSHVNVVGSARLALVRKFNMEQEVTYRNYRKFQSDSEMIPARGAQ